MYSDSNNKREMCVDPPEHWSLLLHVYDRKKGGPGPEEKGKGEREGDKKWEKGVKLVMTVVNWIWVEGWYICFV